jgi:hypothetical protein
MLARHHLTLSRRARDLEIWGYMGVVCDSWWVWETQGEKEEEKKEEEEEEEKEEEERRKDE